MFRSIFDIQSSLSAGSKKLFAAKEMPKSELVRLKAVSHVQREKDILLTYVNRSNFIVQLEGYFHDEDNLYLVSEFVEGGELFSVIQNSENHRMSESHAKLVIAQLVLATEQLHARGIVHRGIKPENIVIGRDGYVKLIDFGFAKQLSRDPKVRTHTVLGTPEYLAPEMIQAVGHSLPVDLWCLGVLLFELLAGHVPFDAEVPTMI